MNQPASGIPANDDQPSETVKMIRKFLKKAPKYWKSIAAAISLYAAGTAIFGLYIYLSTIERLDLFMPSIAISPALFAWLFCATLVLLSVIICIISPTIIFAGLVSLFGLSTKHSAKLGFKFAMLMVAGFGLLTFASFKLTPDTFGWSIPAVWVFAIFGIVGIVATTKRQRQKYLVKVGSGNWYRSRVTAFVIFASIIYLGTVLTGVSPAIFIAWGHSEITSDQGQIWIAGLAIFWMLLLCIPVIAFYNTEGALSKKVSNSLLSAVFALGAFFVMSPSLFGLVAYSAAAAVKLRDQHVSEYIVSKKYPKATLDPTLWQVRELKDDEKTITILAFPLFRFGETLLLCPAKYARLNRDQIPAITKYCFSTTKSDVTQAAPTSAPPIYLKETYCGREVTRIPLALSKKQRCIFPPQKINPLAT